MMMGRYGKESGVEWVVVECQNKVECAFTLVALEGKSRILPLSIKSLRICKRELKIHHAKAESNGSNCTATQRS